MRAKSSIHVEGLNVGKRSCLTKGWVWFWFNYHSSLPRNAVYDSTLYASYKYNIVILSSLSKANKIQQFQIRFQHACFEDRQSKSIALTAHFRVLSILCDHFDTHKGRSGQNPDLR